MARRSLRASSNGIQALKKALRRKQGGQTWLAGAVGCSRQTIWSLLQGNPTDCDVFMAVCQEMGFADWQKIAEPEPEASEEIAPSDIDHLVQEVRDRVRPLIKESCGTMRVLDMSYPIGLDDIYTDVNILERITSRRSLELKELMLAAGHEQVDRFCLGDVREERVPGLVAVERFSKLMILGKPGAGKTTFLKRLAMQCIGGKFRGDRVSVFVTLKDFAEAEGQPSLLEYLNRLAEFPFGQTGQSPFLRIAQAGRAMILLDGLDEVREVDSERVLRQIKVFSQHFYNNCFVITCRIAAKEYTFEQFTEVEIADFGFEQIESFSDRWFRSRHDAVKAQRFIAKLKEDQPIRELAASPLLLTLLCLVFEDSGSFPTNRAELYQTGVEVLLKKWDVKRNIERGQVYKGLSLKRKEALLGHIAHKTFEAGNYFFKQREAERYINEYIQNLPGASSDPEALEVDSAAVLKSIEAHHGLFVERARGIYSFSHLTFHEYFTAQEFANNADPQKIEQVLQTLASHVTEKRYREVFLLTVGMLPSADYLLRLMKSQTDALLAKNAALQRLLNWVKEKSISVDAAYKPAAIRVYYLARARARDLTRDLARTLDHALARALDLDLDLALAVDRDHARTRARALALDLDHALARTRDLDLDLDLARTLAFALDRARADSLTHRMLHNQLQQLREQLPAIKNGLGNFKQWWSAEGQDWLEQLRAVMIQHRNIGHDWQFTDEQEELLRQYYDANKLLVDCLNSDCYISREVRQEIEETLLLPIADIEAWKKNKGKCD